MGSDPRRLSIVVPALNEANALGATLARLSGARTRGAEVIVVDGGSTDDTCARAAPLADGVLTAPRGRASQMNAGARAASGDILLFLHADTLAPPAVDRIILDAVGQRPSAWGRFDVAIDGRSPMLRVVAGMMNLRSRLTGIATGDQGIFVTRTLFERIGGYPAIPLMEDIAFSKAARSIAAPRCLYDRLRTSGRRWDQRGVWATIWLMWRLRFAYWSGADPAALAARYRRGR